jgi:hypothetical protein
LVSTITGVTVGAPQKTFNNLVEGYYYVTVTDANGCTESTPIQTTFGTPNLELYTYYLATPLIDPVAYCDTSYLATTVVKSESSTISGMLNNMVYDSNGDPYIGVGVGKWYFISTEFRESSSTAIPKRYVVITKLGTIDDVGEINCDGGVNPY